MPSQLAGGGAGHVPSYAGLRAIVKEYIPISQKWRWGVGAARRGPGGPRLQKSAHASRQGFGAARQRGLRPGAGNIKGLGRGLRREEFTQGLPGGANWAKSDV
jgi:hypothetical protein